MTQKSSDKNQLPTLDAVKDLYKEFWKQAAEQWDHVLRNPVFLSTMAAAMEQSMNLTARVQEMVAASLKTMNMPTRDDIQHLQAGIQALRQEVAELHRKVDTLQPSAPPKKRSLKRSRKKT